MQSLIQYIEEELKGLYPPEEISGFERLIFEYACDMNYTAFLLNRDKILSEEKRKEVEAVVKRLKTFEPIQYILGETEFYGLHLKVNPAVLIPRPETEELIQWIYESVKLKDPVIIDIGTGSGCIALALKKALPKAEVSATDISEAALKTAAENAKGNNLNVDFFQSDILNWESYSWRKYDVIVSNPPYVREMEKEQMLPNVLDFEPENALFVSDSDPLIFYRRIGEFASKYLSENGFLFFEINEALSEEMKFLLSKQGFKDIQIKADIFGKERMLRCRK